MKLFEATKIKNMEVKNRFVMPPMCMYQVDKKDGVANSFHKGHYISRAISQVGLVIVESTGVIDNGRITDYDLGLWDDRQIEGLKEIVDGVKREGSMIAIQLNHAGRKSETEASRHIGPSKISFNNDHYTYEEASVDEIKEVIAAFKSATIRADKAGFDAIEIHAAHGYLINQFISPLSNQRDDEYGKDRFLFLKEVVEAIQEVWPKNKALWLRISATDYIEGGIEVTDWVNFLNEYKDRFDLVSVSGGGLANTKINAYPGFMLDFARQIKEETGLMTIGVGLINSSDMATYALENDYCDYVAFGRELLRNPNLVMGIAKERKVEGIVHKAYDRAYK